MCPNCNLEETEILSTASEWDLYCRRCDVRMRLAVPDSDGIFRFSAEEADFEIIFQDFYAPANPFADEHPTLPVARAGSSMCRLQRDRHGAAPR